MSNEVDIIGSLVRVQFSCNTMPVFIEKKNKDFVYFGENNNYPSFLLDLYRKHPEHNAIIKAKAKYIYGKGLTINSKNTIELAKAQGFLAKANRYEDWNSVYEKTVKPTEIFNGFAWQIIWSLGGTKCEVYPLKTARCRVSPCGNFIYYCKKWVNSKGDPLSQNELDKNGYTEYPAFNPNIRIGTQIHYFAVPEETEEEYGDIYPSPEYIGAVTNIATDVAIANFQNNLVENGMSAQALLTLFNGEPTEPDKKKLAQLFKKNHTGTNNAGSVIFNFTDANGKGAEIENLSVSDLDKQFEQIGKTNQQKIFTGHQITNKSLFGVSDPGALSDRTTIIDSFEQLYNTYVEHRQLIILNEIKMIASLMGVNLDGLEVQRMSPLGVDITDPALSKYFTEDEIREKLGYKPREGQAPAASTPVQQSDVNANLQGLTGREWQHIKRLIREVQKKVTTREAASMLIRNSYGLTDEDIAVLLGSEGFKIIKFYEEKEEDKVLSLFLGSATDDNDDEVIEEGYCFIREQAFKDDDDYQRSNKELKEGILDIAKGNPTIQPEVIAKQLGVDIQKVNTAIGELQKGGLLETGTLTPTEKGINKDIPPVETETYTVYKYVTRPDVPDVVTSTRPFCKKMLAASAEGKIWTREALDNLTNTLGDDAWSYRGGFYTNPNTGEITPFCRHVWKSIRKTRRKNA